jgi:excisionase family DNA binding protein
MPMQDALITIKEAAQYLSLSVATVYRLVESRKVPFFKIGSAIRFRREALQDWLETCLRPPL